jgi:5'-methylthioadenosine phosphorylase
MTDRAEIGVFGGSGFYSLLDDVREIKVDTPYGAPSDSFFLATVAGRGVAFLPRHGRRHTIPPHMINYRANVWAMRSLGVKAIISPCAAGSLQLNVKPGDFVVSDQFVDRTRGREDTFFDGPIVTHLSSAATYDPVLRKLAIETIRDNGIEVHETGTVVVIQGPRFSTKAESKWFSDAYSGGHQMTQYPEAWPCRALDGGREHLPITDYDAGFMRAPRRSMPGASWRCSRRTPSGSRRSLELIKASRRTSRHSAPRPRSARPPATATPRRPKTSVSSRPGCQPGRPIGRPADRGLPRVDRGDADVVA